MCVSHVASCVHIRFVRYQQPAHFNVAASCAMHQGSALPAQALQRQHVNTAVKTHQRTNTGCLSRRRRHPQQRAPSRGPRCRRSRPKTGRCSHWKNAGITGRNARRGREAAARLSSLASTSAFDAMSNLHISTFKRMAAQMRGVLSLQKERHCEAFQSKKMEGGGEGGSLVVFGVDIGFCSDEGLAREDVIAGGSVYQRCPLAGESKRTRVGKKRCKNTLLHSDSRLTTTHYTGSRLITASGSTNTWSFTSATSPSPAAANTSGLLFTTAAAATCGRRVRKTKLDTKGKINGIFVVMRLEM